MASLSITLALFLVAGLYALALSRPVERRLAAAGCRGTVSLQFAWKPARAAAIIGAWRTANVLTLAQRGLLIDFGFIPLYVAALLAALRCAARVWPGLYFHSPLLNTVFNDWDLFLFGYLTAVLAGIMDGLENWLQLAMLREPADFGLAPVAAAISLAKWTALAVCAILVGLGIWTGIALERLPT